MTLTGLPLGWKVLPPVPWAISIILLQKDLRFREWMLNITPSDNPEFNELMEAFCGPGGLEAFGKVLDEKMKSNPVAESQEEEN